jgi:hypothetical protein
VDIVEAWRKSRLGRCACTQCFYCDRPLDVHQHDHYPIPKRAGGTATVAACVVCHDLKDRIPLRCWDVDAMHAAFDELFLEEIKSMRNLPAAEVLNRLDLGLSAHERDWLKLSPLARVLLAKLRCHYEYVAYMNRPDLELDMAYGHPDRFRVPYPEIGGPLAAILPERLHLPSYS